MTPLLKTSGLKKTYHTEGVDTPVLHGIDLEINKGEFLAIMGPSGSGKSTLLHILGFLDTPSSGKYWFDNIAVHNYSPEESAHLRNEKIGFVFQSYNLLPRTSVFDNVELPLLYSKVPENEWPKRVMAAIEAVGLGHRVDYESGQLSGGEKQRVAIARALVMRPNVIFADEPTGNLDSKSGKAVMEIFEDLNEKEGHTVILITHESMTAEHADRIIHIKDGLIEKDSKNRSRRRAKDSFSK